jgi:TatD DNase family protein
MIDTHSHLNFPIFDDRRAALLSSLLGSGAWIINVGTNHYSSSTAVEIAESYEEGVYASIGLHPLNIRSDFTVKKYGADGVKENFLESSFDYGKYSDLVRSEKVIAIGETGLDYWTKPKGEAKKKAYKELQGQVFQSQITLAKEYDLPLIVHSRAAFTDTFDILKREEVRGVMHCFVGAPEEMDAYLGLGLYIGFTGVIFKMDMDEVIRRVPSDRMLLETDCPYLVPDGFDNPINDPSSLNLIARKIAALRGQSEEEVIDITTVNAKRLFNI